MDARAALPKLVRSGRVIVKIGSGVLTDAQGQLDARTLRRVAKEVAPLVGVRRWPYIVSSGAIAVGMGVLGLKSRPRSMAGLQAAAAVGQSKLVEAWAQAFRKYDLAVAQVLLTHADLADRRRFLNARRALGELERRRAIAIINENDTVSFEEIAFGDNDQLAAMVSNLVDANLLVMLSVAPGILDEDGARISETAATDAKLDDVARPTASRFGSGGMISKLRAARMACARGAHVAIVSGREPGALSDLLDGRDVGTLLLPGGDKLSSRAHWIAHVQRPTGRLVIDAGAATAIRSDKKSLLPTGIAAVDGEFSEGDVVDIMATGDRAPFARGLSRYSANDMRRIAGQPSSRIRTALGFTSGDAAVHRDDLVLLDAPGG